MSQGFAIGYMNKEIIKLSEIDEENFENFELVIERIILTKNKNEILILQNLLRLHFLKETENVSLNQS